VFRRLFWLLVGIGLGFGASFWLMRFIRTTIERYSPEAVSANLTDGIKRLGDDLKAAVAEGREAMREREAELRAEIEARRSR
jgi:gas vesicle protein